MESDESRRYRIEESDLAEADRTAAFLAIQYRRGTEYANAWHMGLLSAIQHLAEFPGPLSNPVIREHTPTQTEIRRLLYRGPGIRRSRMQAGYRVLYRVTSISDEEETIIRILRILHTAAEPSE